jgi:hypothetical protein
MFKQPIIKYQYDPTHGDATRPADTNILDMTPDAETGRPTASQPEDMTRLAAM